MIKKIASLFMVILLTTASFVVLQQRIQASEELQSQADACCLLEAKWDGTNPNGSVLEEGKTGLFKLIVTNKCATNNVVVTLKATLNNPKFDTSSFTLAAGAKKTIVVKLTMPKKGTANSTVFKFSIAAGCGKTYPISVAITYKKASNCQFLATWESVKQVAFVEVGKEYIFKLTVKNISTTSTKFTLSTATANAVIGSKEFTLAVNASKTVEIKVKIGAMPSDKKFKLIVVILSGCSLKKEATLVIPYKGENAKPEDDFSAMWDKTNMGNQEVEAGKTYAYKLIIRNGSSASMKFSFEAKTTGLTFNPSEIAIDTKKESIVTVSVLVPTKTNDGKFILVFIIKANNGKTKEMKLVLYYKSDCCSYTTRWAKDPSSEEVEVGKTYTYTLYIKNSCTSTISFNLQTKCREMILSPASFKLEMGKEQAITVTIKIEKREDPPGGGRGPGDGGGRPLEDPPGGGQPPGDGGKFDGISITIITDCGAPKELPLNLKIKAQ